jgi:DNA repair protein RecN (Recombination protein N)
VYVCRNKNQNAKTALLKHLTIKNYALIERLETDFYPGFSVMTGETGAGKSIILGALGLILGQRADLQALMNKHEKCIVEGIFGIDHAGLKELFVKQNLDYAPDLTILRREILPSGKSRAFVNDTPVNLPALKEIAVKMLDIHSQNSVTQIQDNIFQLNALDSFAGLENDLVVYRRQYEALTLKKQQLTTLLNNEKKAAREQDFYRFQLAELEAARLSEGEQEEIEEELKFLTHAEEIKQRLMNTAAIFDKEHGLMDMLKEILNELKPVATYHKDIETVFNTAENAYLELKEAVMEVENVNEKLDIDPERTSELNERISLIYNLQHKHRTDSIAGLLQTMDEYASKIADYSSVNDQIDALSAEIKSLEEGVKNKAFQISDKRKAVKAGFESKITTLIAGLGMSKAKFSIHLEHTGQPTINGFDRINFLFNANRGGELQEMAKVASGGELSRILLAIKAMNASKKLLSTIIFDEIDSGVSGEIAGKMGSIMQKMATNMQVLAITHLPQIAARGRHHYVVFKHISDDQTKTFIRELNQDERISEIAKMLSDATVTNSALDTARELLKN